MSESGNAGSDKERGGLYEKYEVRKDGEPVEGCFVLEPESDDDALIALRVYAQRTDDHDLARDLRSWIRDILDRKRRERDTDS